MRLFIERLPDYIMLAMSLGMVDLIITKAKIFEKPRKWLSRSKFLNGLINCPICFGTWMALPAAAFVGPIEISESTPVDFIVSWFFMDFWICFFAGVIYFFYKDSK
jgi:hypothetical protein